GVNALRQHITPDARISGVITDGGTAANVTPEYSHIEMMTRALHVEDVLALRERVHDCARGAALMTGCELEIHDEPAYANRLVLASLREVVIANMPAGGGGPPPDDPQPSAAAASATVSQPVPP